MATTEEKKFTVKNNPDGTKEISFYGASRVTASDLLKVFANDFPGTDLSKIFILPCMITTITDKKP